MRAALGVSLRVARRARDRCAHDCGRLRWRDGDHCWCARHCECSLGGGEPGVGVRATTCGEGTGSLRGEWWGGEWGSSGAGCGLTVGADAPSVYCGVAGWSSPGEARLTVISGRDEPRMGLSSGGGVVGGLSVAVDSGGWL